MRYNRATLSLQSQESKQLLYCCCSFSLFIIETPSDVISSRLSVFPIAPIKFPVHREEPIDPEKCCIHYPNKQLTIWMFAFVVCAESCACRSCIKNTTKISFSCRVSTKTLRANSPDFARKQATFLIATSTSLE